MSFHDEMTEQPEPDNTEAPLTCAKDDTCPEDCACRRPLPKPEWMRGMWRNSPPTFDAMLQMAAEHADRRRDEWERRESFDSAPREIDSTRSADVAEPEARGQGRWRGWLRWLNY